MAIPISMWFVFLCLLVCNLVFGEGTRRVPAVYIFGDSTFDVGTNDFLPQSEATANYLYYGIDFPHSLPTGRFSNGYNTADQIVKKLGYDMSPRSFLELLNQSSSFSQDILNGVNFASGGSGIFYNTGIQAARQVISLEDQIRQFSTVCSNISEIKGQKEASYFLSKALILVSVGSNDIFQYHKNVTNNSTAVSSSEFLTSLVSTYHGHLQRLYDLGGRKFGIISIPPLGCCPHARNLSSNGSCIKEANDLAQLFFNATDTLLQTMASTLDGMKYSHGNAYEITYEMINCPVRFKFNETETACCGNRSSPCRLGSNLCANREGYLFWDAFHPTQAAAGFAASAFYSGDIVYARPMNINQLALIN